MERGDVDVHGIDFLHVTLLRAVQTVPLARHSVPQANKLMVMMMLMSIFTLLLLRMINYDDTDVGQKN